MDIRVFIAVSISCLCSANVLAEPACSFKNTEHRRISGDNPDDFQCIKSLAAEGDEHWQYYLGLILIGQVPGEKNIPEGVHLLNKIALSQSKYNAQAMRFLGETYKKPNSPYQNNELAYQWFYLASQQPQFKGGSLLPDEQLTKEISSQRMKELEISAPKLLQSLTHHSSGTPNGAP